jgi:aspartate racemase
MGVIRKESREEIYPIMNTMIQKGAQGIILGCTEIESLVKDGDCAAMLFPTARIHVWQRWNMH